jgi:Ca-activated chloride channel homolog
MCCRFSRFVLIPVVCIVLGSVARSQEMPALESSLSATAIATPTITITKQVNEVNLIFTVTDKKGRFINNIPVEDLQVLDNHLAPERLNYFQQQSELPLRVALLIDTSDSISSRFKFEKQAAAEFLKKVLRPDRDQAMVASFDSQVHIAHDLTGDVSALAGAINSLKAGGDTKLYDAIVQVADKLRASSAASTPTRRGIILITDGMDTKSRALLFDAQQALTRAEAVVFALSTNSLDWDPYPKGDAVLNLLTRPTGGYILAAREKARLSRAFAEIAAALRSQYALGYHPAELKNDGAYRPIEVSLRRPNLEVHCRKGYFAPREGIH